MPAKKDKSSKLKLPSKQHLGEDRVKKLLERESYTSGSDNEECKIIGMTEKPEKIMPNPDSPPYFFEDLFCNSGDEFSDEATDTSPTPKKKLQPKKRVSESSDGEKQTRELKSDTKAKFLRAQKDEAKAKVVARTKLEEAKAKLARANQEEEKRARQEEERRAQQEKAKQVRAQKEKAKADFARAQREKAELARAQKLAKVELVRTQKEEAKAKLLRAHQEKAKLARAAQEEAKLKLQLLTETKSRAKKVLITEKTDVAASKKNKLKLINCPSHKETEKDDDCKKMSQQTLTKFRKLLQLNKSQPDNDQSEDGSHSDDSFADKSPLMESKVETAPKEAQKKKSSAKQPVERKVRKKPPQLVTSEEELDEYEEEVPKPRKKDVLTSTVKPKSKQQKIPNSKCIYSKFCVICYKP